MRHIQITAVGILAALALAVLPASATAGSARQSMLQQINSVRAYVGLHPLRLSGALNRSSYRYARYLMRRDRFGHASRIRAAGNFRLVGEVLAMHRGHRAAVGGTLRAWMRSPSHRAIVFSRRFHWIGLGRAAGRFHGRRATIWVGHFGRR